MWTETEMQEKMNKIHNMDCLEFMKQVPDNYFDLVLTDPPYGINAGKMTMGSGNHKFKKDKSWDEKIPTDEIFIEIFRISKNQIIWGGNYFTEHLPPTANWIVWDKKNPNLSFAEGEMAWCSMKGNLRIYQEYSASNMDGAKLHPTQKPTQVFRYSIDYSQRYIRDDTIHTIFDPFIGSGTTAVISQEKGLYWCGCELEPDYVEIANKRLSKVQTSMFAFMEGV